MVFARGSAGKAHVLMIHRAMGCRMTSQASNCYVSDGWFNHADDSPWWEAKSHHITRLICNKMYVEQFTRLYRGTIQYPYQTTACRPPRARTALRLRSILLQAAPQEFRKIHEAWSFTTKNLCFKQAMIHDTCRMGPRNSVDHLGDVEAPRARLADARCNFRSAFSVWPRTRKGTKFLSWYTLWN